MLRLSLSRGNSKTEFSSGLDYFIVQPLETLNQITIDVTILNFGKEGRDFIPDLRVLLTKTNGIDVADLLNSLKFMGHPIENNYISYFNPLEDVFVYIGKDPLPSDFSISLDELARVEEKYQVVLRIREDVNLSTVNNYPRPSYLSKETFSDVKIEEEIANTDADSQIKETMESEMQAENSISKTKRTKNRKIGQVMDVVVQWRKLYNGYTDPDSGTLIKMSLEAAAARLGMSKKSLDDYLLQIRFGKKYGFNFTAHLNESVGVLRAYVKKRKNSIGFASEGLTKSEINEEFDQFFDKKVSKTKKIVESNFNLRVSTRSKKISK